MKQSLLLFVFTIVASYTLKLSEFLKKSFDILNMGGEFWIFGMENIRIINPVGGDTPIIDWMRNKISGLSHGSREWKYEHIFVKETEQVRVPNLYLLHASKGAPPAVYYTQINPADVASGSLLGVRKITPQSEEYVYGELQVYISKDQEAHSSYVFSTKHPHQLKEQFESFKVSMNKHTSEKAGNTFPASSFENHPEGFLGHLWIDIALYEAYAQEVLFRAANKLTLDDMLVFPPLSESNFMVIKKIINQLGLKITEQTYDQMHLITVQRD